MRLATTRVATPVLSGIVVVICAGLGLWPAGAAFAQQGRGAEAVKALLKAKRPGDISKASVKSRNQGASAASAASNKPALVGTFNDWGVYVSQSAKSKICYALAQPKDRSPADLKRDSAYVFISNRPGESVRGEVSMIMGLPLKDGANGAVAEIGTAKFDLVAKGQNAFIKNAAEEGRFVDTLRKRGSRLTIKAPQAKGPTVADTYSLAGLSQALDRVGKECP